LKISPARLAAFDVLIKIERNLAFSAVVLPAAEEKLSDKDASLCHELVLGVLRRRIYLDRIIDKLAGKKKLDLEVCIALRLGIYQLRFLEKVPTYAAVNESVELVQRAKKTSAKGFVNAILKKAMNLPIELDFTSEIERVSVETSHPEWLIEKWVKEFGMEVAFSLATANNEIPKICFRPTGMPVPTDLRDKYDALPDLPNGYSSSRMTDELKDLAKAGAIYFQDEGSQVVANSAKVADGGRFFDVCAAPGGKMTQIALTMDPKSSMAVAGDIHWSRVEFLRENCRDQGVGFVNIVQYDAVAGLPFSDGAFDTILVDTPCTGTGTIRHNPEIRYFLQPEVFAELSGKQLQILENASKLLTKRGTLVYSTCSLEREENEEVCGRFLSRNPEFRIVDPNMAEKYLTGDGYARTFPHRDNMDGFFVAAFGKA
jgi:16S rRNA (cytosine967-C5)-methyltransferase